MGKMYRVYSVIERPKQEDFWLNIGVAFAHEKGDGFNLMLQALPLHGNRKLVMRAYDLEPPVTPESEKRADPSILFRKYRLISASQLICGQDHSNGAADQAIAGELRSCPGVAQKSARINQHGAGEAARRDRTAAARRDQRH